MSKFINVDEFLSSIPDDIEPDETEWCPICKMMSKEDVEDIVNSLDAIDLSETIDIIHCSECQHSKVAGGDKKIPYLVCMKQGGRKVCYNGFCNEAERQIHWNG